MSGQPALTYEIKRSGNRPQEVTVTHEGKTQVFKFGPHVPERKVIEMLPRLVMDFRTRRRKKVV